jgi:hypothetical protein
MWTIGRRKILFRGAVDLGHQGLRIHYTAFHGRAHSHTFLNSLNYAWSLKLREEHRLRVFEDRVLRTIFRRRIGEVPGGWRELHNEEPHNLCFLRSIIRMINSRRMRWAGHLARMGKKRNTYRLLVVKPEGKVSLSKT